MKYLKQIPVTLLLLSIILTNNACNKDNPPPAVLPAITQEGKNTVGFTINGEVWVPYAKCGFGSDPCGEISARYSSPLATVDGIDFQFERQRGNSSSSLTISTGSTGGTVTSIGNKIDSINVGFRGENWDGNTGDLFWATPGKFIYYHKDRFSKSNNFRQFQICSERK